MELWVTFGGLLFTGDPQRWGVQDEEPSRNSALGGAEESGSGGMGGCSTLKGLPEEGCSVDPRAPGWGESPTGR